MLRALLQPEPTLELVDAEPVGDAAGRVVARVLVAGREEAARVAGSTGGAVPVVVVSPDGRWAGRYVDGRLEDSVSEASGRDLVRLVLPDESG